MTSTRSETTGADAARQPASASPRSSWRTVDVVVASAVGVAFGVIFWAWGTLWQTASSAFSAFPPAQGFMYGVWLVPGVLGGLLIRKRGAAVYTELVAAVVSALLGVAWGLNVVAYGLVEGAAAEIVFAFVLYTSWRLPVALVAGATAGAAAALLDLAFYYPDWSADWQLVYGGLLVASSTVIAGLGSWLVVRALARTGVLAPFAAGRDQTRI